MIITTLTKLRRTWKGHTFDIVRDACSNEYYTKIFKDDRQVWETYLRLTKNDAVKEAKRWINHKVAGDI